MNFPPNHWIKSFIHFPIHILSKNKKKPFPPPSSSQIQKAGFSPLSTYFLITHYPLPNEKYFCNRGPGGGELANPSKKGCKTSHREMPRDREARVRGKEKGGRKLSLSTIDSGAPGGGGDGACVVAQPPFPLPARVQDFWGFCRPFLPPPPPTPFLIYPLTTPGRLFCFSFLALICFPSFSNPVHRSHTKRGKKEKKGSGPSLRLESRAMVVLKRQESVRIGRWKWVSGSSLVLWLRIMDKSKASSCARRKRQSKGGKVWVCFSLLTKDDPHREAIHPEQKRL